MELRALKYFQAVYEQGSISAAARKCFVSQPSITAAVQQLEMTLNVSLFVRHARGVLPTPEADKLYPTAKEMTDNEKSILNMFTDAPVSVPLRLGIMRSLGARRMSNLLKKLSTKIPNLELTLVDPDEPCDARIISAQSVAKNENFVPIWKDNYQLALPKDWPLAEKDSIDLHDFDTMPFINRTPCYALEQLKNLMNNTGAHLQPRANIRTIEYAWQLVSAGVGAALLPDWQEITQADELILKPIEDTNLTINIGLAFKISHKESTLISAVNQVCQETCTVTGDLA